MSRLDRRPGTRASWRKVDQGSKADGAGPLGWSVSALERTSRRRGEPGVLPRFVTEPFPITTAPGLERRCSCGSGRYEIGPYASAPPGSLAPNLPAESRGNGCAPFQAPLLNVQRALGFASVAALEHLECLVDRPRHALVRG
jgi:hypothetical protein